MLLPNAATAQLIPLLPFDHKQFTIDMVSGDHLRLTGEVFIEGDGFDLYADQVDVYLGTSADPDADSPDADSPGGPETDSDRAWTRTDNAADEENGTPTARLVASGDVVFSAPEVRLSADRVEYRTVDQRAVFHEAYGWIDLGDEVDRSMFGTQEPDLLFHGQMIERTGPRTYKITKGAFTSCLQPTPRWQLVATSFTLNLDSYALLVNMILKVKGVPVFYLPGMYYPIQEDGRATGFLMPTYGASRYQGSSLSNAFFWAIDRSQDTTFYYDKFMQHGGDGHGAEYRYTRGNGSQGRFRVYRLNEPEAEIPYAGGTRTRDARLSDEYRGDVRQGLPADWTARAQIDYFTDITVRQTYHTNVFDASNSRRSMSGNLSGPVGDFELSSTYDYNETFFGTDAALNGAGPRIGFGQGKTELFGTPLYFSFDAEYASLLRRSRPGAGRRAERGGRGTPPVRSVPRAAVSVQPLAVPQDRQPGGLARPPGGTRASSTETRSTSGWAGNSSKCPPARPVPSFIKNLGHAEQRLLRADEAPHRALGGRLARQRHRQFRPDRPHRGYRLDCGQPSSEYEYGLGHPSVCEGLRGRPAVGRPRDPVRLADAELLHRLAGRAVRSQLPHELQRDAAEQLSRRCPSWCAPSPPRTSAARCAWSSTRTWDAGRTSP